MRTRKASVAFEHAFKLKGDTREFPAGTYEIEIDEDEIPLAERTASRRLVVHVLVHEGSSMRTISLTPAEFDAAVERDAVGPS